MQIRRLLNPVLNDDALTRDLGDAEARVLVEWLAERVEGVASSGDEAAAEGAVRRLCRRARGLSRFVHLWCQRRSFGAAAQLAAAEGFAWPFPEPDADPCDLMARIVEWEGLAMDRE